MSVFRRVLACIAASLSVIAPAFSQLVPYPPTPLVKLALNPVTNKVYVVNEFSDSVTVLNAASGVATTVATGPRPQFIAVNPLTNKVYVNNAGNATLTVIDGATDTNLTPTPLAIGSTGPISINTATNVVYIVRLTGPGSDEITLLNGNTNTWYSIATASFQPTAMSVNPVTNKLYIAHYATGDVRVISGVFNPANDFPATVSIGAWSKPFAIATNPVTNKTYVLTEDARGPIGIINGADNTAVFSLPLAGHGVQPRSVAVNPVSNRIYAAFKDEVIVIDGATGAYTYVPIGTTGTGPVELGINYFTNRIFVAKANGEMVVINGDTNATSTVAIPVGAVSVGTNPITNRAYIFGTTTTVIDGSVLDSFHPNPLSTSIAALPGNTSGPSPSLMMTTTSAFSPAAPEVRKVYYQLDSASGAWTAASGTGPYSASFTGLAPGQHTLYAFATDSQDAPTSNGAQSSPLVGNIASYTFTVSSPSPNAASVSLASSLNPSETRQGVTFTASVTGSGGTPGGTVDFLDNGAGIPGCIAVVLAAGSASCGTSALAAGTHPISASYSGSATFGPAISATVNQVVTTAPPPPPPPPPPAQRRSSDMNGDGKSDLLYRNATTGAIHRILLNGYVTGSSTTVYSEPNLAWKVVADADFNGDGVTDLLWRNTSDGKVFLLPFDTNGNPLAGIFLAPETDLAWKIVHTPDINGDGKADILWWNSSTGQVRVTLMDGATVLSQGAVYSEPNLAWKIVAVGDFAGSGKTNQLLWRNSTTGQLYLMTVTVSGSTFSQSGTTIYTEPDTAWKVVGAADFNGDGKTDILYRNDTTGAVFMLLMNGSVVSGSGYVYAEPNLAWKIVAQGDYNGDGKADILYRNDATGQVYLMLMNGLSIAVQGTVYREPNTAWRLLGPAEYAQ